ncbi:potassium channel subfamily K member 18 [Spea bombifrons]|uniref:potassium channel subfamily K member 18 n=1 Tax=Spea bombifrons TaxID=233779 RepID=UPI00234B46A3|nr:potassium channel subfamily K member 18 [Spea bombifrons]
MSNAGQRSLEREGCGKCPRLFWVVLPHACLILSLALYSVVGAFIFQYFEKDSGKNDSEFKEILMQLWNISQTSCPGRGEALQKDEFLNSTRDLISHKVKVEWLKQPGLEWNFLTSLFFCCTVFTTVGYGHLYPDTRNGKIACIIYATFGIPLMLLLLTDLGDILAGLLSSAYKNGITFWSGFCSKPESKVSALLSRKSCSGKSSLESTLDSRVSMKEPLNLTDVLKKEAAVKTKYQQMRNINIFEQIIIKEHFEREQLKCSSFQKSLSCPQLEQASAGDSAIKDLDKLGAELEQLDVPISLIALVLMTYIMFGALVLPLWEKEWTTLDAFYFCFITLTTIGFGDVIPQHPNYFLLLSVYIVVGMAIMTMAFKLLQNRMVCLYKHCMACISHGQK